MAGLDVSSALRLDLLDGLRQQLLHGAADLVIRYRHLPGIEVAAELAEHILIPGGGEIGVDHVAGVGLRLSPGEPELFGCPAAEQPVPARRGLEFELLVMGEFALEAILAPIETVH